MKNKKLLLICTTLLLSFNACAHGPKIDICLGSVEAGGFKCVNAEGKEYFLRFDQTNGLVCTTSDGMRTLLEYCGLEQLSDQNVLLQ